MLQEEEEEEERQEEREGETQRWFTSISKQHLHQYRYSKKYSETQVALPIHGNSPHTQRIEVPIALISNKS